MSTLPQLEASLSVELERAPSRTSATVTWMAYLCIGASSPEDLGGHDDVLGEVLGHAAADHEQAGRRGSVILSCVSS